MTTKKGKDLKVGECILLYDNGYLQVLHPLSLWMQWTTRVYGIVSIEEIRTHPLCLAIPGVKRFALKAMQDEKMITRDIRDEEDVEIEGRKRRNQIGMRD